MDSLNLVLSLCTKFAQNIWTHEFKFEFELSHTNQFPKLWIFFSENQWNIPNFRALNFKNYQVSAQILLTKFVYQWTLYNFYVGKSLSYVQISRDKASGRLVDSAIQTETKFQRNVLNFEAL